MFHSFTHVLLGGFGQPHPAPTLTMQHSMQNPENRGENCCHFVKHSLAPLSPRTRIFLGRFLIIERFRNIYGSDSDLNSKMKSKRSEVILNVFEFTKIFGLVVHLHLSTNFLLLKSDAHMLEIMKSDGTLLGQPKTWNTTSCFPTNAQIRFEISNYS
jgi:hypothetical protein